MTLPDKIFIEFNPRTGFVTAWTLAEKTAFTISDVTKKLVAYVPETKVEDAINAETARCIVICEEQKRKLEGEVECLESWQKRCDADNQLTQNALSKAASEIKKFREALEIIEKSEIKYFRDNGAMNGTPVDARAIAREALSAGAGTWEKAIRLEECICTLDVCSEIAINATSRDGAHNLMQVMKKDAEAELAEILK